VATVVDAHVHFDEVRPMPSSMPQMLRADARDNRDRLLEAARTLFAERGIDVTMRDVARRAEVGPATLYRRFPTKQTLIDEVFADELRACAAIVEDGCRDPDAWRGLRAVLEGIGLLNARNQAFVDAFLSSEAERAHPERSHVAGHRAALRALLADLLGRAQAAGDVRRDVVPDDLVLVILAGRGLSAAPPEAREAAALRFAGLAIEAFRASGPRGALPPPARLGSDEQPEGWGWTG
jgi:AcrR family transcriptional regulator